MNLPPEFISTITNTFGKDGDQFIANLPALVEEASQRWGLTNIQPVSNLSYNFVAYAESPSPIGSGQGEGDVVLKIGIPRDELTSEIAALRLFNGEGACELIDADEEKGFLLLERLKPGDMLSTLEDDNEATHIAAQVMKKIWQTVPQDAGFIKLSDWFDELKKLRPMFNGGTGPFNERLVERVERSVKDFFTENHQPVLMHGDFHHFNILSSERGWLVIDPKGVIGPAGYEVGPFMMNPWRSLSEGVNDGRGVKRRIDILHEHLGWERERILEWSLAYAILSAWWDYPNLNWGYSTEFAELLASL